MIVMIQSVLQELVSNLLSCQRCWLGSRKGFLAGCFSTGWFSEPAPEGVTIMAGTGICPCTRWLHNWMSSWKELLNPAGRMTSWTCGSKNWAVHKLSSMWGVGRIPGMRMRQRSRGDLKVQMSRPDPLSNAIWADCFANSIAFASLNIEIGLWEPTSLFQPFDPHGQPSFGTGNFHKVRNYTNNMILMVRFFVLH